MSEGYVVEFIERLWLVWQVACLHLLSWTCKLEATPGMHEESMQAHTF
jgi:hypothetical protein